MNEVKNCKFGYWSNICFHKFVIIVKKTTSVRTHKTSKQIEPESPGSSGFEEDLMSFKT